MDVSYSGLKKMIGPCLQKKKKKKGWPLNCNTAQTWHQVVQNSSVTKKYSQMLWIHSCMNTSLCCSRIETSARSLLLSLQSVLFILTSFRWSIKIKTVKKNCYLLCNWIFNTKLVNRAREINCTFMTSFPWFQYSQVRFRWRDIVKPNSIHKLEIY